MPNDRPADRQGTRGLHEGQFSICENRVPDPGLSYPEVEGVPRPGSRYRRGHRGDGPRRGIVRNSCRPACRRFARPARAVFHRSPPGRSRRSAGRRRAERQAFGGAELRRTSPHRSRHSEHLNGGRTEEWVVIGDDGSAAGLEGTDKAFQLRRLAHRQRSAGGRDRFQSRGHLRLPNRVSLDIINDDVGVETDDHGGGSPSVCPRRLRDSS